MPPFYGAPVSTATGIRTRVSAMRGRRPSPLDDSGARSTVAEASKALALAPRQVGPSITFVGTAPSPIDPSSAGAISSLAQRHADVAELVDAHGSGPCLGNQVEVRVLSSASTALGAWLYSGGMGSARRLNAGGHARGFDQIVCALQPAVAAPAALRHHDRATGGQQEQPAADRPAKVKARKRQRSRGCFRGLCARGRSAARGRGRDCFSRRGRRL
jgi:hypothetical protein